MLAAILLVACAAIYAVGVSGVGTERLRIEAEAALRRAAGPELAAAIGPARISLDASRFLALNISDLTVTSGGASAVEAGTLQFGIRVLPLLTGKLQLGSAKISDARISVATVLRNRTGDWTQRLRNEDGLIDPDLAGAAVFDALHKAFDALQAGGTRQVELANTELVLAETGRIRRLVISSASLADVGNGQLVLSAEGQLDGRALSLRGTAQHDDATRRIADLSLDVEVGPAEELKLDASGMLSDNGSKSRLGGGVLKISGSEVQGGGKSRLALTADITESVIDFGKRGVVVGDADLVATLDVGSNKLEVDRLELATGQSRFALTGAFGPQPKAEAGDWTPAYRYEFVTTRASLLPIDSPEPAIGLSARIAGRFDETAMKLTADKLEIRTGQGELVGVASATFVKGKTPGLSLALSARDMPVTQLKQFWPWMAAGRARQWALQSFFGGRTTEAEVLYKVAPGRIGDGVPLNGDEISGRFEVVDSRFDTTGALPPIRDAAGSVTFRGNDVDVNLASGKAFLASGKQIAVSQGILLIRDAHKPPVVGNLDLDIEGSADAVAELAALEPINALRRINMSPTDFRGRVTGHVTSQVPFQKAADLKRIEWNVALDFVGLDVAKPFDGQKVTDAKGNIRIDRRRAEIDADAQLNGVPAQLKIVEPFSEDGPERVRDIAMTLNDKQRNQIAPGLDGLVSGSTVLKIDASGRGTAQSMTADLTKAQLDLPWVGWSKGAGVPAKVSFKMLRDGSSATLSDFELSGKSFAASGTIKLGNGGLSSAKFGKVALNRGDAARVDIARQGKGYNVSVSGAAFDGRALIKLMLGDADEGAKSKGGGTPVAVKASIERLTGFGDETLSNVELDYRSSGGRNASYTASAATRSGAAVSVRAGAEDGRQVMRVQAADAGAFVRFLDIYDKMQGGQVNLALAGQANGAMRGQVNASGFAIVNEPRLGSLVSTKPAGSDRSLNQAVRRDIDTSKVQFERGYAVVEKGNGYLSLDEGILRGPMIGASFQGTLYDKRGNIDMTGTFMPAYGLNRIFGELPIIGALLGNGSDRGLIGVTFKLEGKADKPQLQVNPLSVIAPGIFRQIFEFR